MAKTLLLLLLLTSPLAGQTLDDLCQPECADESVIPESPTTEGVFLEGLACYYSDYFEGRKTASGEIFRQKKMTAAHLTLPFGTWLEITSVATGRSVTVRVNDRGPYSKKFVIDLSREAARAIGVDRARDRTVRIRQVRGPVAGGDQRGSVAVKVLPSPSAD